MTLSTGNWDVPRILAHGALAAGMFYVGYKSGSGQWFQSTKLGKKVAKSYQVSDDPVKAYCLVSTVKTLKVAKLLNSNYLFNRAIHLL